VRVGERMEFMGEVPTVMLERRFLSRGRACALLIVVRTGGVGTSGVGVSSRSVSTSMSLSSGMGSGEEGVGSL